VKRVGHKGADLIAPGNTIESFEAALSHGVDMIEFDVLRLRDGSLVLAHDYEDAGRRRPVTLDEGLDHFAGEAYADVELDVDLKLPGYEREVVEGLAARGLRDRSLISTTYPESLDLIGRIDPDQRRGWSVPRARRDYTQSPLGALVLPLLAYMRRRLPAQAALMLRGGRCEAVMCHWRLVSPALVQSVHSSGGHLYVWTVDDAAHIEQLSALGVDGVITNDPRLFG
jgi:glycerophosphoryl diester phosphodiesterase